MKHLSIVPVLSIVVLSLSISSGQALDAINLLASCGSQCWAQDQSNTAPEVINLESQVFDQNVVRCMQVCFATKTKRVDHEENLPPHQIQKIKASAYCGYICYNNNRLAKKSLDFCYAGCLGTVLQSKKAQKPQTDPTPSPDQHQMASHDQPQMHHQTDHGQGHSQQPMDHKEHQDQMGHQGHQDQMGHQDHKAPQDHMGHQEHQPMHQGNQYMEPTKNPEHHHQMDHSQHHSQPQNEPQSHDMGHHQQHQMQPQSQHPVHKAGANVHHQVQQATHQTKLFTQFVANTRTNTNVKSHIKPAN